jgi:hypothetical protein
MSSKGLAAGACSSKARASSGAPLRSLPTPALFDVRRNSPVKLDTASWNFCRGRHARDDSAHENFRWTNIKSQLIRYVTGGPQGRLDGPALGAQIRGVVRPGASQALAESRFP